MIAVNLGTYTLLCLITGVAIGIVVTILVISVGKTKDKQEDYEPIPPGYYTLKGNEIVKISESRHD